MRHLDKDKLVKRLVELREYYEYAETENMPHNAETATRYAARLRTVQLIIRDVERGTFDADMEAEE